MAIAQNVLFDFDNAPLQSPLPIAVTVSGITANLSATGQGFSIQRADVLGFTPVGFSGYSVYPSSIYPADLIFAFSRPLTDFSILYAPEEYGCDTSARMRVSAFRGGTFVGTSTMTAQAGTWPSATLSIAALQGFDHVVVHYDAPPSGENWGPIFMADNMNVTPALVPGDYDLDGVVDMDDYLIWQSNFGATASPPGTAPDGDSSGVVDAGDYVIWRHAAPYLGSGASIPEPAALLLICLGTCGVCRCVRVRYR
jgi:hypothetical protein